MNEFSYIDIFATKGIEYLLVIGFFLLLAAFWSFLSVPKKEIRKAQEEREELRRLLDLQRERMETEMARLRDQRDMMQNALLARLQLFEHRAIDAWREAHPEQGSPPELGGLLDWVLAEHDELVGDKKRLELPDRARAVEADLVPYVRTGWLRLRGGCRREWIR